MFKIKVLEREGKILFGEKTFDYVDSLLKSISIEEIDKTNLFERVVLYVLRYMVEENEVEREIVYNRILDVLKELYEYSKMKFIVFDNTDDAITIYPNIDGDDKVFRIIVPSRLYRFLEKHSRYIQGKQGLIPTGYDDYHYYIWYKELKYPVLLLIKDCNYAYLYSITKDKFVKIMSYTHRRKMIDEFIYNYIHNFYNVRIFGLFYKSINGIIDNDCECLFDPIKLSKCIEKKQELQKKEQELEQKEQELKEKEQELMEEINQIEEEIQKLKEEMQKLGILEKIIKRKRKRRKKKKKRN